VLERLVVDRLVLERLVLERMRWAALVAAAMVLTGCGGDSDPAEGPTNNASCSAASDSYQPFDAANYANQIARVDAYNAIKKTRKSGSFSAADFGDLNAVDGANKTPSDNTLAALYVETASLAEKVAGRKDDHAYAVSYNAGSAGAYLDELIRSAITQGAAADAVTRNAVGSIDWHGQRIDKGLQHFFYLSVFHEMLLGARKNWDEAFGYYGRDADGDPSGGISATVASRDDNCGLGIDDIIFAKLIEAKCELDKALTAAGTDSVDPTTVPALDKLIKQIDLQLLTVFALSAAREFRDLPTSDKPSIKLIEGRVFFGILEPFMIENNSADAAFVRAEVDKDVPSEVDTAAIVTKITAAFGLEQTFADCN